jgi:hypothetical protein
MVDGAVRVMRVRRRRDMKVLGLDSGGRVQERMAAKVADKKNKSHFALRRAEQWLLFGAHGWLLARAMELATSWATWPQEYRS